MGGWVRHFCVAAFVCVWTCQISVAAPADVERAKATIQSLENRDPRVASAAARDANQTPYKEVADALIQALQRPDPPAGDPRFAHVVSYALASLKQFATASEASDLMRARPNVERIVRGLGNQQMILRDFEMTIAAMRGRINPLIKLEQALALPTALPAASSQASNNESSAQSSPTPGPSASPGLKTAEELVDASSATAEQKKIARSVIGISEHVFFNDSIRLLNKGQLLPQFPHREQLLEKILQAMLRTKKAHVLMTGKAGVGKTVLAQMLQNGWLNKELPYPGREIPIVLELPILDLTNQNDPTVIKNRIQEAKTLADVLNRDVVILYDEASASTPIARTAVKSFLTETAKPDLSRVHFIWNLTSSESRAMMSDPAFLRRWVELIVDELTPEQAISAIRSADVPRWRATHQRPTVRFESIDQSAFDFAVKFAHMEQPHAGNPTAMQELLEGAIVHRLRQLEAQALTPSQVGQRPFTLEATDIRSYLKFQKNIRMLPGDPDFEAVFEQTWTDFRQDYPGQDGAMANLKDWLRAHFATLHRDIMLVVANFGPPGAGKSFLVEMLAKHFLNGALLKVNSGMFSEGGHPLNVLIGSSTGLVGSEEQRSILTQFMKENPWGGIVVFEEADFLPQQILDFLAEVISDRSFRDGLGQTWSTDNYIFVFNSNIGQELLLPTPRMTWDEFNARKRAMTQTTIDQAGHTIETVRPDKLDEVFARFIEKISRGRHNKMEDTGESRQNGMKLNRRMKRIYSLLPSRDELEHIGRREIAKYLEESKRLYGVQFEFENAERDIPVLLGLDAYKFDEGFAYVKNRLNAVFLSYLNMYLGLKDQVVSVRVESQSVQLGRKTVAGYQLAVTTPTKTDTYPLGLLQGNSENQWFANDTIRQRIRDFPAQMSQLVRNQTAQIEYMHRILKAKVLDWSVRLKIVQIGTTGNGKTEFGFAMAETLFGSRKAAFKMASVNTWQELQNYFRSPVGFVGNNEETEFEKWFNERKTAGGGVIILDEFLSFTGMNAGEISEKIMVINKLYDLYDTGMVYFAGKPEDASAFILVTTGNSMQELFNQIDDTPEAEQLVKKLLKTVSKEDILKFFRRVGLDAPKLARLGEIFLNGPLPKSETHRVGRKDMLRGLNQLTRELSQYYRVDVHIDDSVLQAIVDRVTTVKFGMRFVNDAIDKLVKSSVGGILFDLDGAESVAATLAGDQIVWTADGVRVLRIAQPDPASGEFSGYQWLAFDSAEARISAGAIDVTPQLRDIEEQAKLKVTDENLFVTAVHEVYGHWMVKFLLTGQNQLQTVSLIPGDGYLGFVRMDTDIAHDVTGISAMMKELAVLQAGHRAVFLEGIYSTGGGAGIGNVDKKDDRNDDQAQADRYAASILSNSLFDHYSEFGSADSKTFFKEFLKEVAKGVADWTIVYGKNSGVFLPFFEEVMSKRFAGEDTIKEFVSRLDRSKLMHPDLLYLSALSEALQMRIKSVKERDARPSSIGATIRLAKELFDKTKIEIQNLSRLRGENINLELIQSQFNRALEQKDGTSSDCTDLLRPER